ncbi:ABC transporter permease [Nonomuraea sp. NPDC049714]|uniref:ABC transporter permease n=1 Tax=Nonomuraea sp. NPDC049714 TaxID=3364357 RepID=UPI0037B2D60E
MIAVVRSELTKIVTQPTVWLVTGILVALHVLVQYQGAGLFRRAMSSITPDGMIQIFVGRTEPAEPALIELLVAGSLQICLFVWVLGAVIAGSEIRAGQLGVSVLAVPSRARLILGKAIATALYALVVGLVFAAIATAFMYLVVKDWNPSILWSQEAILGQSRILLLTVTITLVALGITLIARRTLVGIIAIAVLLGLTMTQLVALVSPVMDAFLPYSAARNLLLREGATPPLTADPLHATIVLIAWASISVAVAGVVVRRRDAR